MSNFIDLTDDGALPNQPLFDSVSNGSASKRVRVDNTTVNRSNSMPMLSSGMSTSSSNYQPVPNNTMQTNPISIKEALDRARQYNEAMNRPTASFPNIHNQQALAIESINRRLLEQSKPPIEVRGGVYADTPKKADMIPPSHTSSSASVSADNMNGGQADALRLEYIKRKNLESMQRPIPSFNINNNQHHQWNQQQLQHQQIHQISPKVAYPSYNTSSTSSIGYVSYPTMNTATVSFSLLNTKEFMVKADGGHLARDVILTIRKFPVKLDPKRQRLIFPIQMHDRLLSAFGGHKVAVEPLPRHTIAAAMLQNQREYNHNNMTRDQQHDDEHQKLSQQLPESVLKCIAPFQKEGVEFAMKNQGRMLLADEMGLGKTRTAIASAMLYQEDWPVLVVCPSSARHHWYGEIVSILSPDIIDAKDVVLVESAQHTFPSLSPPAATSIIISSSTSSSTTSTSDAEDATMQHISSSTTTATKSSLPFKFLIVSYGLINKLVEKLESINFNVIIADESHYLKNPRAKRTKRLLPLIMRSKRAILISGTPALSRPIELFTQLHALDSHTWDNEKRYGKRYCQLKRNQTNNNKISFGQEFKGASNTRELHVILTSTLMIRRLKADILQQLPKKHRKIVKVEVRDEQQRIMFKELLDEIAARQELVATRKKQRSKKNKATTANTELPTDLNNTSSSSSSSTAGDGDMMDKAQEEKKVLLMQLFTQSGEAKLPDILPHITAFLNDPLSGKLLIFGHHRPLLDRIQEHITSLSIDFMRIDGRTSSKERQARAQHFQNSSKCRVGILSITAAGIAITLTAAATVFFVEIFWTPGSLVQAEDRAHRIGQNNVVNVTYFLADGTIDELLWPLVRQKFKTLGEVVEGHDNVDLNAIKTSSASSTSSSSMMPSSSSSSSKEKNIMDHHDDADENLIEGDNNDDGVDGSMRMDDLEDVAREIAETCTDMTKSSSKTDIADEEEEDDGDDDDDRQPSSDNFDKLIDDDNEEADQLAVLYKDTELLLHDPIQLASYIKDHNHGRHHMRSSSSASYQSMSQLYDGPHTAKIEPLTSLASAQEKLDEILRRHGRQYQQQHPHQQHHQHHQPHHHMQHHQQHHHIPQQQYHQHHQQHHPIAATRSVSKQPQIIEILDDDYDDHHIIQQHHSRGTPQVIDMVDDDEVDWVEDILGGIEDTLLPSSQHQQHHRNGSDDDDDEDDHSSNDDNDEQEERNYYYDDADAHQQSTNDPHHQPSDQQQHHQDDASNDAVRPRLDGSYVLFHGIDEEPDEFPLF